MPATADTVVEDSQKITEDNPFDSPSQINDSITSTPKSQRQYRETNQENNTSTSSDESVSRLIISVPSNEASEYGTSESSGSESEGESDGHNVTLVRYSDTDETSTQGSVQAMLRSQVSPMQGSAHVTSNTQNDNGNKSPSYAATVKIRTPKSKKKSKSTTQETIITRRVLRSRSGTDEESDNNLDIQKAIKVAVFREIKEQQ